MLRAGLVSVTFRQLQPQAIVELCQQCNLQGIEWGADRHVVPQDIDAARAVGALTREAGLQVAAYGSYFRAGANDNEADFGQVLKAALALGSPLIRVWAGPKGSAACSTQDRELVTDDLVRCQGMAQAEGVSVAVEYHGGTLTDSRASTRSLLERVAPSGVRALWQPLRRLPQDSCREENLADLMDLLPHLAHVHMFSWHDTASSATERFPLAQDLDWPSYIEVLRQSQRDHWCLLEFVPGDEPTCLAREAEQLHRLLGQSPPCIG